MTMRHPLDGELMMIGPTLVPTKKYQFTWPGQPPRVVSGAELAAICKGADHAALDIHEVAEAQRPTRSLGDDGVRPFRDDK